MFHVPFIPSSATAAAAAPTGQYTDLSVYGMDHNEYIDLNNIEPSLFPPAAAAPCAYGTTQLPNQSTAWIPAAKPQISQISAKLAAAAQERPKCGGGGGTSGSGSGGGRANGTAGPKTARRKKAKKDPNEPQKPVSAYALFFRDTQAAIKGRSPNATFGEVSKIVASMWDSLDFNAKNSYKQKTESAKRDYLKRLAAYRASQLQSQDNNNANNNNNTSNTNTTNNGCSNISSSSSTSTSSSIDPRDNSRLLCVSSPYEQQQQQLPTTANTQQQIQDMSLINPITIANSKQYFNPATTPTNFTMPERHVDYIGNEWNVNTRCVMVQQPQTLATNFG